MAHIALDFIYLKRINFCGAYRITANGLRRLMNQNSTCLTYNNASDFGLLFGLQPKFSPVVRRLKRRRSRPPARWG